MGTIWMINMLLLGLLLGLVISDKMYGGLRLSLSFQRMVYPQVDARTPHGRSTFVEIWTGGGRRQ